MTTIDKEKQPVARDLTSEPKTPAGIPAYIPMMFAFAGVSEKDNTTIETRYGAKVSVYAIVNARLFHIQRKYSEMFAGPLAQNIQCYGMMAPLLISGCTLDPAPQCTMNPTRYYVDVFSADTSSIVVRDITIDPAGDNVTEPVMRAFRTLHLTCTTPPAIGQPALLPRPAFEKRMTDVLSKFGHEDRVLREIINDAGAMPAAAAPTQTPEMTPLEVIGHNYCIAGGFVSKMIDPVADMQSFTNSDVDIFVYGEHQERTIDNLVEKLFVPGETYITVRGSVVSVYRTGAIKVQIVSSACGTPCGVISEFDLANVMLYWSNGTVWANANCIRAFATRVCSVKRATANRNETRIIKLLRGGFRLSMNKNTGRRRALLEMVSNNEKLWASILSFVAYPRIDRDMSHAEIIARIMHHDNVLDVLTTIVKQDPSPEGAREAPQDATTTTPQATISKTMMLRHAINGYSTANLCDVDWNMVNISKFPTSEGTTDSLQIAGFRARIIVETLGKISLSEGPGRNIYILSPKCGVLFGNIVRTINRKLADVGLPPLEVEMTEQDGIVKITVDCTPKWHPPGFHPSMSVLIALQIKCISLGQYKMVITAMI